MLHDRDKQTGLRRQPGPGTTPPGNCLPRNTDQPSLFHPADTLKAKLRASARLRCRQNKVSRPLHVQNGAVLHLREDGGWAHDGLVDLVRAVHVRSASSSYKSSGPWWAGTWSIAMRLGGASLRAMRQKRHCFRARVRPQQVAKRLIMRLLFEVGIPSTPRVREMRVVPWARKVRSEQSCKKARSARRRHCRLVGSRSCMIWRSSSSGRWKSFHVVNFLTLSGHWDPAGIDPDF